MMGSCCTIKKLISTKLKEKARFVNFLDGERKVTAGKATKLGIKSIKVNVMYSATSKEFTIKFHVP